MQLSALTAISPLDGRYGDKTEQLRSIVSEYSLIFYRLRIEIEWLLALADNAQFTALSSFSAEEKQFLKQLLDGFTEKEAQKIKLIEKETNHDVKAIEYYLREKLTSHLTLNRTSAYIHFACTSEDINNLAYALMVKTVRDTQLKPALEKIVETLDQFAHHNAAVAMLSRTHGQLATPTTLGKEFKNSAVRLHTHLNYWLAIPIMGKCNGAVGNFNAHVVAYPEVNWLALSQHFVESLGLQWNSHTTQIEPHDFLSQWFNGLNVCHTILIDFCRDIWGYISLNYFTQKKAEKEVGSSTMPHKINPIDFENAEGNLGLAIALATHLSQKLPISRWQRDLSDSTVLRNIGSVAGYSVIAYQSLLNGLKKLVPNETVLKKELSAHPEVLTEAIQTVMRCYGIIDAYEQLKAISRGETITQQQLIDFVDTLSIPAEAKKTLRELTPEKYIGLAAELARQQKHVPLGRVQLKG